MSVNNVTQVLVNAKGLLSWTRNRLEADIMRSLVRELENALEGLYKVYVNLGEDTDGARNAKELFGPWVGFDPAKHVPDLVMEHRLQSEEDYERALELAWDEGWETGVDWACEAEVGGGLEAAKKYDKDTNPYGGVR